MKRLLLITASICFFVACLLTFPQNSLAKGKTNEFKQLQSLENSIQHKNWQAANKEFTKLNKLYSKNLWKYQIFGNKNEYGKLQDEMAKLQGAIKANDQTHSLVIVSYIRSLFKQIYSP